MAFQICQDSIPRNWCEDVVRRILLDVRDNGLDPNIVREWNKTQAQFHHLRECDEILLIAGEVERQLQPAGERCQPQIVWHLPDHAPDDMKPWPHIDEPPEGKQYTLIAGVCLSEWDARNGGLWIWIDNDESREPECSDLWTCDIITMSPDQKHSPGINRSHEIRSGLYFRWIQDAE